MLSRVWRCEMSVECPGFALARSSIEIPNMETAKHVQVWDCLSRGQLYALSAFPRLKMGALSRSTQSLFTRSCLRARPGGAATASVRCFSASASRTQAVPVEKPVLMKEFKIYRWVRRGRGRSWPLIGRVCDRTQMSRRRSPASNLTSSI